MVNQAFAQALVRLREGRGISQEALALEIGYHRTYISQLERSINSPTLRTLHRIATFFGLSLVDLMALVEEEMARFGPDPSPSKPGR